MVSLCRRHRELIIWLVALVLLAIADPNKHHFTLCIWHNLGIDFCPGCGLGRSISHLFRGNIAASWQQHPLGIFALIVLFVRIKRLVNQIELKAYSINS